VESNRLLVIDDEPLIASVVGKVARLLGFDVITTDDPSDLRARLRNWQPGFALTFLLGNHEQLLAQVIMHPDLEFGGDMGQAETFESYLGHEEDLAKDLHWMNALPLTKMIETKGQKYLFVHAGIVPGKVLDEQPDRAARSLQFVARP